MSNVVRMPSLGTANTEIKKEMAYPLATGGDGGDSGGMDRLASLEKRADKVDDAIVAIKETLASISARMATKDDIIALSGRISAIEGRIGKVEGRLEGLPTTSKILGLITLAVLVGGAILGAAHYWGVVIALPVKT